MFSYIGMRTRYTGTVRFCLLENRYIQSDLKRIQVLVKLVPILPVDQKWSLKTLGQHVQGVKKLKNNLAFIAC